MNPQIPIVTARPVDAAAPATQMVLVQVPPGVEAGMTIQVQAPDGQMINAQVPPGVDQFYVSVPAKQIPVVPAYPVNHNPQAYRPNNGQQVQGYYNNNQYGQQQQQYGNNQYGQQPPYGGGYNNNQYGNNQYGQQPPYGGGYNNNYNNQYPPNRPGMGAGGMIAGVALAGTAGYLLGSAMKASKSWDWCIIPASLALFGFYPF